MGFRPEAEACPIAPVRSSSWRRPALGTADTIPAATGAVSHEDGWAGAFGVYVHWPFCLSKCPYCDFNSHVRHTGIDEERYVRAFASEIAATAARTCGGGAAPSRKNPGTAGALLDTTGKHGSVAPDVEVTLEANPTSVEA